MRIVIQRVTQAAVSIDGQVVGQIGKGFVLLVGITHTDTEKEAEYVAKKVAQMRIFSDSEGKMNLSLAEISDSTILSISQFTLYADCRHGNRPAFIDAARPEKAEPLYNYFNQLLRNQYGMKVETGRFGADMQVSLINDGPVTIVLDSI
ncbi:MAG: D-tyrosyl-tRNA(Tyr) deacylase [Paludibacteraceae bacterium]|nr:D-tyrosyl-tRNA(Tyr) deacylase [Paludibacteraceae bacterium]